MKVFIIFALVCCLSVIAVSSKWVEVDDLDTDMDTEFDDFEGSSKYAEVRRALYEDILDELIAAADDKMKEQKCKRDCKSCVASCKPKKSKLSDAAWVKGCKTMRKCPKST